MITWRGRGWLIAAITFGCLVGAELFARWHFRDGAYYQRNGWPKLVALLIAAGLVWLMVSRHSNETLMGVETAPPPQPILRDKDTLFHIPAKYWPLILCALGMIFYFVRD